MKFEYQKNSKIFGRMAIVRAKDFKCENCSKHFGEEVNLERHIKNIHHVKKYQCEKCYEYKAAKIEYRKLSFLN